MKILLVGLESLDVRVGGLNRYLDELRLALNNAGVETSRALIANVSEPDLDAVKPDTSWFRRVHDFSRAIRRSDADVIDVHFAAHASWAIASGALRRRPLVVHFQGPWSLESATSGDRAWSVTVKTALERYVLRRAATVITLSGAFRDTAIERYGVAPHRVRVVAPSVRPPEPLDRGRARDDLGLRDDHVAIVAVRRLVERMGLDRAISAFADVRRDGEILFIIGDGPVRTQLEDLARARGVSDSVHFLGSLDDEALQRWYAAADVSIVPSVAHEGYGLVVLESLAHGTPVIASDLEGLRDAARTSRAVRLIDWSPTQLREAIDALVHDEATRALARDDAGLWTWEAVADEHTDIYANALDGTASKSVVILDHTARRSGGELAIVRLVSGFDPSRWHPHVVLAEHGDLEAELERRGISFEVLELPSRTRDLSRDHLSSSGAVGSIVDTIRYAVRVRRTLRQRHVDVVHTNSMKAHVYGSIASFGARWALVMHVRDQWAPPYVSSNVAWALRLMARYGPDAVVANSGDTAISVRVPSHVVPSPLESAFFDVGPINYSPTLRVAVIGRLAPWKGQDLAVRALAALPTSIPWRLSIAGDALFGEHQYRSELEELITSLGVADRVSLLGQVDDVPALLGDVDVCLLTSRSPEPFGNVVTEAMAAGRVVIVPNAGGVTEYVVEEGEFGSGFFFEPDSADSLRAAIVRVAESPELRTKVGENAREVAARFRVDRVAPVVEDLYDKLVAAN